jgi:ribonuclease BN (tRNA processing enzyme)
MLRLTVLGSADAFNSGGFLHSAYLLEGGKGTLLLECGPSVLAGLKRQGLTGDSIDAVLVSHLHGDHFGGIPFLLLEYLFESPRTRPLLIAGPSGIQEKVQRLYDCYYSSDHLDRLGFELRYLIVAPGDHCELAGLSIHAFEVPHGAEPYCLGFRVDDDSGASLLFSGDSAWTEEFVERSQGVELFLCECCFMDKETDFHVSYTQLAANRHRLGCERLLVTHVGSAVRQAADLDAELAVDGQVIELGTGDSSGRA